MNSLEDIVEQHERLGRAVTSIIAEFAASLDSRRVASEATPADLEKLFAEPLPELGISADEILARFRKEIAPHAMAVPSPRYFGQFNPAPLPIGVWADALASALNQNAGAWRNGPTSAMIEARVMRWLCDLIGYGEQSFGTLASGGSEANLIALKCARDSADKTIIHRGLHGAPTDLIVYASEQCHYSIEKSADILGRGRDNLRKIRTDKRFISNPTVCGRKSSGTETPGAPRSAWLEWPAQLQPGLSTHSKNWLTIAHENGCWFHVDAAYGGVLAFSELHKNKLDGIEHADSIAFDPHKWMFVPFACGAVLVREGGRVLGCF